LAWLCKAIMLKEGFMKKIVIILGLVATTSLALADCLTLSLAAAKEEISNIQGLTAKQQALFFDISKNTIVIQVLACAELNEAISIEIADFVVGELVAIRMAKIKHLTERIKELQSSMQVNIGSYARPLDGIELDRLSRERKTLVNTLDPAVTKIIQLSR